MKHTLIFILASLVSVLAQAQTNSVSAGVYPWPNEKADEKTFSTPVIVGSAFDLKKVEITANVLASGKQKKTTVPGNEEHVVLIKSGLLTITVNDSVYKLGKGSIAMVMPSDKYSIKNKEQESVSYHLMKYESRLPIDVARGKSAGGSFIKDWNKLTFTPQEKGGTRPYFNRPTAMTRKSEIHVTTLKEGWTSHEPHTHKAEEIILILEGNVEMLIGENSYKATVGDILFAPSGFLHGLENVGKGSCSYFAFQWE